MGIQSSISAIALRSSHFVCHIARHPRRMLTTDVLGHMLLSAFCASGRMQAIVLFPPSACASADRAAAVTALPPVERPHRRFPGFIQQRATNRLAARGLNQEWRLHPMRTRRIAASAVCFAFTSSVVVAVLRNLVAPSARAAPTPSGVECARASRAPLTSRRYHVLSARMCCECCQSH